MITDNTAKWKLKKVTNFTDKSAEIATQAQAEEGVDNTKVMTPLRVTQAVDKNWKFKSYNYPTGFGASRTDDFLTIIQKMPLNSILKFYASPSQGDTVDNFPNLDISTNGVVEIIKYASNMIPQMIYFYPTNSNKMYYRKVINASELGVWIECIGTNNLASEVQKDYKFKTYDEPSQVGINIATATIKDVCIQMPDYSVLRMYTEASKAPNFDFPTGEEYLYFEFVKRTTTVWITARSTNGEKMWYRNEYWGGNYTSGWKKVATTPGALSMPSGNAITLSLPKYDVYNIPADGWFYVEATNGSYLYLYNQSVGFYSTTVAPNGGKYSGIIPANKRQRVYFESDGNSFNIKFIYAQSEV